MVNAAEAARSERAGATEACEAQAQPLGRAAAVATTLVVTMPIWAMIAWVAHVIRF